MALPVAEFRNQMTMKYIQWQAYLLAAGADLQEHSAEDGTVYWSMILGDEAIHIVRHGKGFVVTTMRGQQIGATRTLSAAALYAAASLLQAA